MRRWPDRVALLEQTAQPPIWPSLQTPSHVSRMPALRLSHVEFRATLLAQHQLALQSLHLARDDDGGLTTAGGAWGDALFTRLTRLCASATSEVVTRRHVKDFQPPSFFCSPTMINADQARPASIVGRSIVVHFATVHPCEQNADGRFPHLPSWTTVTRYTRHPPETPPTRL